MINQTNVPDIFLNVYQNLVQDSESERIQLYRDLRTFYDNDKDEIESYLKRILVTDKKLYSLATFNKLVIRHRDNIQKILNRITVGIYENPPERYIIDNEDASDKLFEYLTAIRFNQKIKEAFRKGKYFNCLECYILWNKSENKVKLEIITPDIYVIETKDDDYTKKNKIYIQQYSTSKDEISYAVWSDTENYILNSDGSIEYPEGNLKGINPYNKIPCIKLQFSEGLSYWSEPNWDLFDTQISLDIRRTNNFYTEMFQTFGVWVATNLNLPEGVAMSPNQIVKADNVKSDDVAPGLVCVTPAVDWSALNNNIDFDVKDSLRSQGINAASASLDATAQSGASKEMDEVELTELRETNKEILYNFEIEVLEMIRTVQNYHSNEKLSEGEFDVIYSEEKTTESITDKIKRRDFEKANNMKTPIDFIQEDLEISTDDATVLYNDNKQFNELNTVADATENKPLEDGENI